MKGGVEHRVPLSDAALACLQRAAAFRDNTSFVFPSSRRGQLSDNTLSKLFRDLNIPGTPHGCRSSFRDWCAETGQPANWPRPGWRTLSGASRARTSVRTCSSSAAALWINGPRFLSRVTPMW